jgi:hypothetical protein
MLAALSPPLALTSETPHDARSARPLAPRLAAPRRFIAALLSRSRRTATQWRAPAALLAAPGHALSAHQYLCRARS